MSRKRKPPPKPEPPPISMIRDVGEGCAPLLVVPLLFLGMLIGAICTAIWP